MTALGDSSYRAALGLTCVCNAGGNAVLKLLRNFSLEEVWHASRARLEEMDLSGPAADTFVKVRRSHGSADAIDAAHAGIMGCGGRFLPLGAPGYPAQFLQLSHPPAGVYVRGSEERLEALLAAPRVTIVGTRRATGYGSRVVREFTAAFTARGLAVASGMALGIDGRAHETALEGAGLTVAILGSGVDVVYPQRHRGLYELILQRGVVMSELPPGAHATQWSFPNRNRLLAALGDGVLVVEGAATSGAMQTAEQAIALGRAVFAVPGHIYLDGHRGCNLLLRDGATPAIDPSATVEEFLLQTRIERGERGPEEATNGRGQGKQDPFAELAAAGREDLLEAMDERPCSIDALVRRTGKAPRLLSAAIAELELAGLVRRSGPGLYIRAP